MINSNYTSQKAEIDNARRLLSPSKVLPEIPKWAEEFVFDRSKRSWLDHVGSIKGEDGVYKCCAASNVCFISEPYEFDFEDALDIENLCNANNLEWHLSSNSWHYPGHTLRIIIHPKQKS